VSTRTTSHRLGYLDWLRGITVLVMIEAHTFDAWTLTSERARPWFGRLMVIGGMAAPLFLFLAGVAVSLAAASHMRRGVTRQDAARRVEQRGWQIFAYAFLFRLQSFVLGGLKSARSLLKVDILNIMGPAIAMTALVGRAGSTRWRRAAWLTAATAAVVLVTPWIRTTPLLDPLPDPLEWYIRPPVGQGTFTLFPWAAFVPAGAVLGLAIDGARASNWWRPSRLQQGVLITGLLLIGSGIWAASRPAVFPASFWTTSPTYFLVRTGILLLLVCLAWLWSIRPWARPDGVRPLETLGVGSLFVYWVHVELVYGVAGRPLRHALTLEQCFVAWALFSMAMFALLLGWNASKPTRQWLTDEVVKLLKSETWSARPIAGR
jgi:uncharacterized membrane protein